MTLPRPKRRRRRYSAAVSDDIAPDADVMRGELFLREEAETATAGHAYTLVAKHVETGAEQIVRRFETSAAFWRAVRDLRDGVTVDAMLAKSY